MGDLKATTYFSGQSVKAIDSVEDLEAWAATLEIKDSVLQVVSGRVFDVTDTDYGAVGDGVTDDAAAVQLAIDAAEAVSGGIVFFPRGTYIVGTKLRIDTARVILMGDGPGATRIQMADGANLDYLVHFGPADGATTSTSFCGIHGLTLVGNRSNQTSGTSLLYYYNCPDFRYSDLQIISGFGAGVIESSESATAGSTRSARAFASRIHVNDCAGDYAVDLRGCKNSRYLGFQVNNNSHVGVRIRGLGFTGNFETTQCQFADFHITDNGTDQDDPGLVLDNTTRWVLSSGHINFNVGGGIEFRRTGGTAGTDGGNDNLYVGLEMRNNGIQASVVGNSIRTASAGDLRDATFNGVEIQPITGIADQIAVDLNGADHIRIVEMRIQNAPSVGARFTDCDDMQVGILKIRNCGQVAKAARDPHGLLISGGSGAIADLWLDNSATTSANSAYELAFADTLGRWHVNHLNVTATDAGQELTLPSGQEAMVTFDHVYQRGDEGFVDTIASASTIGSRLLSMGRVLEITGTTTINTIPLLAAGYGYKLRFTNAAPGGLGNAGNITIPSPGTSWPVVQNGIIHIVSNGTTWSIES